MKQLTIKHLGRRLHAGVKMYQESLDGQNVSFWELTGANVDMAIEFQNMPILRPLQDLTKPIRQANYKAGKEFVPIEEIAKILISKHGEDFDSYEGALTWCDAIMYDVSSNPFWINELLIQWHFVIEEPSGTWISVHDLESNPYE